MRHRPIARLMQRAPRNADFGRLQEIFLLSAITTILWIRTQLWLTNYPQLGGKGLHIAHLLYGGIFMVLAIGILVTLLGHRPRLVAAVVGGIGFGFFIDELGKFITSDNNYFFQPAAALIYLIFVGLFLLGRWMQRQGNLAPSERVANAIVIAAEAARRELTASQKQRALALLDDSDRDDPFVRQVRGLLEQVQAQPDRPTPWIERLAIAVRARYFAVIERGWFRPLLTAVFALWALLSLLTVWDFVLGFAFDLGGAQKGYASDAVAKLHFVNWASLVSSATSAVLVAIGLVALRRRGRADAYRWFARALLVAIFVTRVFAFVESQFGAVFGLAVDLLLFVTVRYMLTQEEQAADTPNREGAALEQAALTTS